MMQRRDFLKALGIGAFACAVHNVPALGVTNVPRYPLRHKGFITMNGPFEVGDLIRIQDGTYTIIQREGSQVLLDRPLEHLITKRPEVLGKASMNVMMWMDDFTWLDMHKAANVLS